jgi:hypothetical protein
MVEEEVFKRRTEFDCKLNSCQSRALGRFAAIEGLFLVGFEAWRDWLASEDV